MKINKTNNTSHQQLVSNSRELGLNENGFVFGKIVIIRKINFNLVPTPDAKSPDFVPITTGNKRGQLPVSS